ncbi:MAG TPA: maleylpyruvate isomerase family mycothiol-dependent enzyme [Streptosporangiaceae bacterium]|nr:maleylpyruvate isomerase family mycothiol-dependent enzyme [Streptosporangiaceae bacterium]
MTTEPIGAQALREAAERTAALLRKVPDPNLKVPGLEWNVGETTAHLVAELQLYTRLAADERDAGEHPVPDADNPNGAGTNGADTPSRVSAAANAEQLAEFTERDPARLADLLVPAADAFVAAAARLPADKPILATNGVSMTPSTMTAALLGEQLIHGLDIARAAKLPWPIAREDALLVIAGVIAMVPDYVDRDQAAGRHVSYELVLRGGPRYRLVIDDGTATVTEPGLGVDCRIYADPVAFLLVGYGRIGQWGPILRGQILAAGRKPWLGLAFGKLITGP